MPFINRKRAELSKGSTYQYEVQRSLVGFGVLQKALFANAHRLQVTEDLFRQIFANHLNPQRRSHLGGGTLSCAWSPRIQIGTKDE
jgi:hypothetical protein